MHILRSIFNAPAVLAAALLYFSGGAVCVESGGAGRDSLAEATPAYAAEEAEVPLEASMDFPDGPTVSAGALHSLAIKRDGSLWAWGDNRFGELGLGDEENRSAPAMVGTDKGWAVSSHPRP
jgi:hypothetical protein